LCVTQSAGPPAGLLRQHLSSMSNGVALAFLSLMALSLAATLVSDLDLQGSTGVGQGCSGDSGSGTCINTQHTGCANGLLESGLCPGPSNVECCLDYWGGCSAGKCITTAACSSQGGRSTPGECPGPDSVQCCTSAAPPPPPGPGSVTSTVNWANGNCAASQGWECAEFTARAIAAGGFIPGLSPSASSSTYGDWDGYNLRIVESLHDYLSQKLGWREQSTNPNSIQAAWAIFGCAGYCPSGGWEHACIGVGSGIIDCHNAQQCKVPAAGDFAYSGCGNACCVNSILSPP